MKLENIAFKY